MLRKQYCEHFGRPAKEPEMMFKLMLKKFYDLTDDLSESFPEKPSLEAGLDEEIAYTEELLFVLEEGIAACGIKKIQDLVERIWGLLDTDKIREIRSKDDEDAAMSGR